MKYYFSYNFVIETPDKIEDEDLMYKSAAEILAMRVEKSDIHSIAESLECWDTEEDEVYA
jgi:hypothetical protein